MNVFGITELFDMILPLVDEVDLLRLQQVCRLFNNRITNNILSQRRLFLSPSGPVIDNTPERTTKIDTDKITLKFNPFLTKISTSPFIDWSTFIRRTEGSDPPPLVPMIQEWDLENKHLCVYPPTDNRTESRWNDMFVTQPPITAVSIMLPKGSDYKDNSTTYPQDFEVHNPAGLTIGDVVRKWKKVTKGNDYLSGAPFCIVTFAFSRYERFYSAYRRVLMEYQTIRGRSRDQFGSQGRVDNMIGQRARGIQSSQTAWNSSLTRPMHEVDW
jgi:hypothetical protein